MINSELFSKSTCSSMSSNHKVFASAAYPVDEGGFIVESLADEDDKYLRDLVERVFALPAVEGDTSAPAFPAIDEDTFASAFPTYEDVDDDEDIETLAELAFGPPGGVGGKSLIRNKAQKARPKDSECVTGLMVVLSKSTYSPDPTPPYPAHGGDSLLSQTP